jgi:regulator of nonsense transcripts 2
MLIKLYLYIDEPLEDDADMPEVVESIDTNPSVAPATIVGEEIVVSEEVTADESKSSKLQVLLNEKLLECVNKIKADEFCVSYCYLNTKSARKQLIQALCRVPRSRSDLIPIYARIIASLSRLYPDMLPPILDHLRKEFYGIVKARKQLHVDSKIRNVRYQAELIKYRIAPPIIAFRMIKTLLADFSPHHVQLLAAFLESCGRYLYLLPYTHDPMNVLLETMLRLRRARNLDLHYQTLIESAYFAVKPPERKAKQAKKEFTLAQQYTRYLIMQRLDMPGISVDNILRAIRKLPWNAPEERIAEHVMKAALKVTRTKYVLIPTIADCLSGLMKFYPNLVITLIDHILEELQRALDSPYKREMQRILGMTRMLGELYNYTAITSTLIFDCLYHLINFGHDNSASVEGITKKTYDPRVVCEVDAPTDLFRAQVICEMLNTIGLYFVRGQAKERMNRFLTYFQRYLLTKQYIPIHIEFTILDTFDHLEEQARQSALESAKKHKDRIEINTQIMFARYDTFDAAQKAVEEYEVSLIGQRDGAGGDDEDERDVEREEPGGGEDAEEEDEEDEEDGSRDSEDNDEEEGGSGSSEDEKDRDEDMSEQQAAKMLEKLRIAEEDDEFERAFRTVMQVS